MPNKLEFAVQLAQDVGNLLMGYFLPAGITASLKADKTLVTEADFAADKLITERITEFFPDDEILSEEGRTTFNQLNKPTWIIDPLDGTTNFSLGVPIWGVSIGRVVNGNLDTAALNFPATNELYSAEKGGGAKLNGSTITTQDQQQDLQAAYFTCCSRTLRNFDVSLPYKTRILGAAAYDFCMVARGAAVLAFQATPKIWDLAAGWLVLEEAGGIANTLYGPAPFPMIPGTEYNEIAFPTFMASSPMFAELAQKNIREK